MVLLSCLYQPRFTLCVNVCDGITLGFCVINVLGNQHGDAVLLSYAPSSRFYQATKAATQNLSQTTVPRITETSRLSHARTRALIYPPNSSRRGNAKCPSYMGMHVEGHMAAGRVPRGDDLRIFEPSCGAMIYIMPPYSLEYAGSPCFLPKWATVRPGGQVTISS